MEGTTDFSRDEIKILFDHTLRPLVDEKYTKVGLGLVPFKLVLLYGMSGCGKSFAIQTILELATEKYCSLAAFVSFKPLNASIDSVIDILRKILGFLVQPIQFIKKPSEFGFSTPQPKSKKKSSFSFKTFSEELHRIPTKRPVKPMRPKLKLSETKKVIVVLKHFDSATASQFLRSELYLGEFESKVILSLINKTKEFGFSVVQVQALISKCWKYVQFIAEITDAAILTQIEPHADVSVIRFTKSNYENRLEILNSLATRSGSAFSKSTLMNIANTTVGCQASDLCYIMECLSQNLNQNTESLSKEICKSRKQGVSKLSVSAKEAVDDIWENVAGYHEVKAKINQSIIWPILYPEVFEKFGISTIRGILLYGPPGTGKSTFARAIADIMCTSFVSIDVVDIFSSPYFGEAEKEVRTAFEAARQSMPCLIFIDEIDSIVGNRFHSGSTTGVATRVLSTLLNEMDGISTVPGLIVLGATNRLQSIDKALLRPGRFDLRIEVPLPDKETRAELLIFFFKSLSITSELHQVLKTRNHTLEGILSNTEGYSGAELKNFCHQCGLEAIRLSQEKICTGIVSSVLCYKSGSK